MGHLWVCPVGVVMVPDGNLKSVCLLYIGGQRSELCRDLQLHSRMQLA